MHTDDDVPPADDIPARQPDVMGTDVPPRRRRRLSADVMAIKLFLSLIAGCTDVQKKAAVRYLADVFDVPLR